jgi:uncharacterized protein (TIGR02466 family)
MKTLNLFPTPVSIFSLEDLSDQENNFIQNINYELNNSEYLDASNSINKYILDHESLINLKNRIQNCLNMYKQNIMGCDQELYITNSWSNSLQKNKRHSLHHHLNSIVSGVYYVDVNKNHPGIRFENPSKLWPLSWKRNKFNNFNSESHLETVQKNTLIIFPSLLWHSVGINQLDQKRISFSFNTFFKGEIKHNGYLADLKL